MKLIIIPISKNLWKKADFQSAIEDAIGSGQRIIKRINVKQERKRFSLACCHIERIARENREEDELEVKGKDVSKVIIALRNLRGNEGITYPFVLPKELLKFRNYFNGEILNFLGKIKNGIVVTLLPYQKPFRDSRVTPTPSISKKIDIESYISLPSFDLKKKYISKYEKVKRAYHQINEALKSNQPFNASSASLSHQTFTEVIRDYIYQQPISFWRRLLKWLMFWQRPQSIFLRISYSDGSEARPFPLFSLKKIRETPKDLPIIRVGLMSMRHPKELDSLVDIYLLRNIEVDRRESSAEQDDIANNRTLELLSEILKKKDRVEIRLYHTGLEPVVVGAYRAIIETLQKYQNKLIIIPIFKIKDIYKSAEAWF